jgi:peptidoglycan/LPS O-acetylase OafA/YrhL
MNETEIQYRPDIDGLRALAVLLVIGLHVDVPLLRGGYVGVDVFFVISGYLITGIITRQIAAGRFTIAGFYERRARRILPALVTVMLLSTVFANIYLLPDELVAYGKSLISASLSYSNFYYWSTADYFDALTDMKPLLHTWSLAVEEQFYLVLPLLLVLLSKRQRKTIYVVVPGLAAMSFALSAWESYRNPDAAFFLPSSRAWELMLGSMLALGLCPPMRQRWLREICAMTGILMIAYAATHYSDSTPFPGVMALLPCFGSFLVIAAGRSGVSLTSGLLSLKPIAFLGVISYSVYLFHWPLIVFTRMGFLSGLPRGNRAYALSILLLSLLLGFLSWRFVEKPFRAGIFRGVGRRKLFAVFGGGLAVCSCLACAEMATGGLPWRFPKHSIDIAKQMNEQAQVRRGVCFIDSSSRFDDFQKGVCMHTEPAKVNYLLFGDSHAAALWYGLSRQLSTVRILQATASGCKPEVDSAFAGNCVRMIRYVFGDFLLSHHVDAVFLTARWHRESDFVHLRSTIDWCKQHGIRVIILGPVMEYDAPLPKLLAYSIAANDPSYPQRHIRAEMFGWDSIMKQIAEDDWRVQYISLISLQCPNRICISYADPSQQKSLLKDDNHFSEAGSLFIAKKILNSRLLTSYENNADASHSTIAVMSPPM